MRKGQKMPENARLQLIERLKGNKSRLGQHCSEEHKRKLKQANTGKKHNISIEGRNRMKIKNYQVWHKGRTNVYSKETLEKFRLSKLGTKQSIETRKKRGEKWKGNKNPNYIDGKSKEINKHYHDLQYKLWRESIFERDNWICQNCFNRGGYLEAHHVKGWAQYPLLRYELSNGITLCKECHKLTDNYGLRGKRQLKV